MNARKEYDSWLKRFWSAKIPSLFVPAFRFLRVRLDKEDQSSRTVKITFCVRDVSAPPRANMTDDGQSRSYSGLQVG